MRKRVLALVFVCLLSPLCFAQKYALVLAGGGGKGAYQVGVWKALCEYGIAQRVTFISGTSVGGLNAALFAVAPLYAIENIWMNEVPVELNRDNEYISQPGLKNIMDSISFSQLKNPRCPSVSVTCSLSWKDYVGRWLDVAVQLIKSLTKSFVYTPCYFCLNREKSQEEIKRKLLATSAFPALTQPVRLDDGYLYSDGGASDNVPVTPVLESDPDIIFVVHLSNWNPNLQKGEYPGRKVVDLVPSRDMRGLGGMLDFSQEWIRDNISLGYSDTKEWLESASLHPVEDYWFY